MALEKIPVNLHRLNEARLGWLGMADEAADVMNLRGGTFITLSFLDGAC